MWPQGDGTPRSAAFDRRQWYEIAEQAEVKVTLPDGRTRRPLLYEARHTAATLLLASGIDETTIKAILGTLDTLALSPTSHRSDANPRGARGVGEIGRTGPVVF